MNSLTWLSIWAGVVARYPLVDRYNEALDALVGDQRRAEKRYAGDDTEKCPPSVIWLNPPDGGRNSFYIERSEEMSEWSSVFASYHDKGGSEYVVKSVDVKNIGKPVTMLVNEKAVMRVLGGLGEVSPMLDISEGQPETFHISEMCRSRTFVTRYVGVPLADSYEVLRVNRLLLLDVIMQGLDILKSLHQKGFVHGSISPWNWLLHSNQMHLVDYGHTVPYVDSVGVHVPEATPITNSRYMRSRVWAVDATPVEVSLLSVWHLERGDLETYRMSRRDDMFRFAEMLFKISSSEFQQLCAKTLANKNLNHSPVHWAKLKREMLTSSMPPEGFPQVFREFFLAMSELQFQQTPQYDRWKELFVAALVPPVRRNSKRLLFD